AGCRRRGTRSAQGCGVSSMSFRKPLCMKRRESTRAALVNWGRAARRRDAESSKCPANREGLRAVSEAVSDIDAEDSIRGRYLDAQSSADVDPRRRGIVRAPRARAVDEACDSDRNELRTLEPPLRLSVHIGEAAA